MWRNIVREINKIELLRISGGDDEPRMDPIQVIGYRGGGGGFYWPTPPEAPPPEDAQFDPAAGGSETPYEQAWDTLRTFTPSFSNEGGS